VDDRADFCALPASVAEVRVNIARLFADLDGEIADVAVYFLDFTVSE
jgi:hypothetical protein